MQMGKWIFAMVLGFAGNVYAGDQATENTAADDNVVTLTGAEQNVLEKTNVQRVANGLAPLAFDSSLIESARQHASWMASARTLRHTSKPVGENIATGQSNSSEAVRTWMNSPPHRANILSRSWSRIGAAAYTSPEGRIYWCLQFLK